MRYLNNIIFFAIFGSIFFASCNKDDINEGITNQEKTLIKLPQSAVELNNFALNADPGQISLSVLEVRRDAVSESELNKTVVVKVAPNPVAISDYNTANPGTNLEEFTQYTLDPETTFDGTNWNVTFNPGEFVKYIKIKFDPSTLDFSKRNAMAFKLASADGANLSASSNAALVEIAVKNQYDGKYRLNGTFYHPNTNFQSSFTIDVEMHTTGPNSVKMYSPDFGGYYHPFARVAEGDFTAFGSQEPNYTIDGTTGAVLVNNSFVGAVTFYKMAQGFTSFYDPASKTIYAKFGYNYLPSGGFDGATTREFTDELIYLGPR